MPIDLEYTLCGVSVGTGLGTVSLAVKTHRREGGSPVLEVHPVANGVEWILPDLFDGVPQTVTGVRRDSHVDFYILLDDWRAQRGTLPVPVAAPDFAIRRMPFDPTGMERPGGKQIRMGALGGPLHRYEITRAEIESGAHQPPFLAVADLPQLHIDLEETPVQGYGAKLLEFHFGADGDYMLVGPGTGQNRCIITMTDVAYAAIYLDLMAL